MAERILSNELKTLSAEPWVDIEVRLCSGRSGFGCYFLRDIAANMALCDTQLKDDNLFHWNIALIVLNPDSLYYGGYFKVFLLRKLLCVEALQLVVLTLRLQAEMTFPKTYPYAPPGMSFRSSFRCFV
jgi:ubiquitin-conjugating enzyme E2 R